MALLISDRFAGRSEAPSSEYPFGAFKNKTSPTGTDGTPLVADWPNDIYGFLQSILSAAGVTPSGNADRVGASQYFDALSVLLMPVGTVIYSLSATPPVGFIRPNGALVNVSAYPKLFSVIGNRFGGNGTTTFALPDFRGEFLRAMDDGRGVDIGRMLGSFQASQNLSHTHGASASSAAVQVVGMFAGDDGLPDTGVTMGPALEGPVQKPDIITTNPHSHTITVNASGGSESRPRNIALPIYIKY